MRYRIERITAQLPPCEGATEETYIHRDQLAHKFAVGTHWMHEGFGHHPSEDGELMYRYREAKAWFIEIPDLAALHALSRQTGEALILFTDEDPPLLRIYDDYAD